MMTLIGRLCTLCAVSALCSMAVESDSARGALRMIGGLLMLHLTLCGGMELLQGVGSAQDLSGILASLVK